MNVARDAAKTRADKPRAKKPAARKSTTAKAAPTRAGYSGTPLGKKLGYRSGMRVWALDMPASTRVEIEREGILPLWMRKPASGLLAAHVFVTRRAELARHLLSLRELLDPTGMVWVSWPKKTSGVATDITEDAIREVALPTGFVDVKVCAIDATWSGLKLMIRKTLR